MTKVADHFVAFFILQGGNPEVVLQRVVSMLRSDE
jgi:hypothetical protein